MYKYLFCCLVLALCGCQTQGVMRVISQPEGAFITPVKGSGAGMAPFMVRLNLDPVRDKKDSAGCFEVWGVTAQWASGATLTKEKIRLCGEHTDYYVIEMIRPQNAPNLNADLNFAMQLSNNKAAEANARAARSAAALGGIAAGLNAMQQTPTQPTTNTYIMPGGKLMNCTANGNVTTCY